MDIVKDFVYVNSAFEQEISARSSARWVTFKTALNLLSGGLPGAPVSILETGCQRFIEDWGAGCSTYIFGKFLQDYAPNNSQLVSIDISEPNLELAKSVLLEIPSNPDDRRYAFTPILADALVALTETLEKPEGVDTRFDLIYLDSLDADPGHEGQTRLSQAHQLAEAKIATKLFADKNPFKILLLDDNNLPWGGKCTLTKEWLRSEFWTCLFDYQQSLWIQKNEYFKVW